MRRGKLTCRALTILTITLTLSADVWAAGRYKVLHTFAGGSSDGCLSYAGLIVDAAGNLYGTTVSCGDFDYGTVFKLTPGTNRTEVVLHSFGSDDNDGRGPWAGLIFDPEGDLYGTTLD